MHELAVAQDIVELARAGSGGARVARVVLEIGRLTAVLPDALRFCFDLAAQDTVVEGARLDIVEVPGLGRCRVCGARVTLDGPLGRCGCGGEDLDWIGGDELKITALEVV